METHLDQRLDEHAVLLFIWCSEKKPGKRKLACNTKNIRSTLAFLGKNPGNAICIMRGYDLMDGWMDGLKGGGG